MASERILFVDDDPVSRRAFARAMRKSGFIVDLAQDGDEAWELATHFPYAVIATDLRMPGMDGMMLIDQLKELQPDPVCLLVTGCKQLEWLDIRRLGRANARVPIVLLGDERQQLAAVEAIRKGAQDWLPLLGLNAVDLARVIATARERSRAPGGPLPVCTELSNPSLLFDRMRQAISRARRFSRQAGVLLVDVDRFGDINSSLGYDAGDELLALVAERLRVSVRESDAVFRLRQDEFALVLEDVAEADTIQVPAQRVLNSFATPFRSGAHEIVLTASIGGAVFPTHGQNAQDLMRRAESALEQAKREGRNRFCTQSDGAGGEGSAVVGPQDGAVHLN
jgi:diguanylate cyclase (GGDEF)-like protein